MTNEDIIDNTEVTGMTTDNTENQDNINIISENKDVPEAISTIDNDAGFIYFKRDIASLSNSINPMLEVDPEEPKLNIVFKKEDKFKKKKEKKIPEPKVKKEPKLLKFKDQIKAKVDEGKTVEQIMEDLELNKAQVSYVIRKFEMMPLKPKGRPRVFTDEQRKERQKETINKYLKETKGDAVGISLFPISQEEKAELTEERGNLSFKAHFMGLREFVKSSPELEMQFKTFMINKSQEVNK